MSPKICTRQSHINQNRNELIEQDYEVTNRMLMAQLKLKCVLLGIGLWHVAIETGSIHVLLLV